MTSTEHVTYPVESNFVQKLEVASTHGDERHILAERFKTKFCRNLINIGACPYEERCMFAHGKEDLRTYEDNIRDGIYTEKAIQAWRRARKLIARTDQLSSNYPISTGDDNVTQSYHNHTVALKSTKSAASAHRRQPTEEVVDNRTFNDSVSYNNSTPSSEENYYQQRYLQNYQQPQTCDTRNITPYRDESNFDEDYPTHSYQDPRNIPEVPNFDNYNPRTEIATQTTNAVRRMSHNPYNTQGLPNPTFLIQSRTMRIKEQNMALIP